MEYRCKNGIPYMLIEAQELQKAGEYKYSRDMYMRFFKDNPRHYMRFKALFEAADNLYYEKNYSRAKEGYNYFLKYCGGQNNLSEQESSWVSAYKALAERRLMVIDKKISL